MDPTNYQQLFVILINLVLGFLGSPLTQWLKNKFNWADRPALLLSAAVAVVLAVVQLTLDGALGLGLVTWDNFPQVFMAVFAAAQFYFGFFKESPSLLGRGFLLK